MKSFKQTIMLICIFSAIASTATSLYGPGWGYGWVYPYGYGYGPYGVFGAVAGTIGTIATVEAIKNANRNMESQYNNSSDREKAKLIKQARSQLDDLEKDLEKFSFGSKEYKQQREAIKEQQNFIAKLTRS